MKVASLILDKSLKEAEWFFPEFGEPMLIPKALLNATNESEAISSDTFSGMTGDKLNVVEIAGRTAIIFGDIPSAVSAIPAIIKASDGTCNRTLSMWKWISADGEFELPAIKSVDATLLSEAFIEQPFNAADDDYCLVSTSIEENEQFFVNDPIWQFCRGSFTVFGYSIELTDRQGRIAAFELYLFVEQIANSGKR